MTKNIFHNSGSSGVLNIDMKKISQNQREILWSQNFQGEAHSKRKESSQDYNYCENKSTSKITSKLTNTMSNSSRVV